MKRKRCDDLIAWRRETARHAEVLSQAIGPVAPLSRCPESVENLDRAREHGFETVSRFSDGRIMLRAATAADNAGCVPPQPLFRLRGDTLETRGRSERAD
jgi:hypothetical protein